jgi:hypothetical protein
VYRASSLDVTSFTAFLLSEMENLWLQRSVG